MLACRRTLPISAVLVVLAAMVIVGSGAPARAQDTVANGASLSGDTALTRFVANLSADVDFEVYTLADPYRVVVDLPEVDFRMPASIGQESRGLVSAFRFGLFAAGKARIVIDVTGPVQVIAARIDTSGEEAPARFILDMVPTSEAVFEAAQAERRAEQARQAALRVPQPERVSRGARARLAGRTVIVLDPGHGGIDTGAIGRAGTEEKRVVLAFMEQLREKLRQNPRYEVLTTRDRDVFIKLRDRVRFSRTNNANLFVSIHADSISRRYARRVRGATVYTLSERGSDAVAREVASSNNESDVLAGVEIVKQDDIVADILLDLAQRETNTRSSVFAGILLKHMRSAARLNRRPHRSAAFRVLKSPDVPSVLLELGYLSNREDEKLLISQTWRDRVATQVAAAIDDYFEQKFAAMPF